MIRVVLAVVLATALLGASLPAVDDARRDHAATTVETELDRVERAARNLQKSDDPAEPGARRIVTFRVPTESWSDAETDRVTVSRGPNGSGGRFTWTVGGGPRRVRHLPELPLRTADGTALTFRTAGRHRLVLTLDGPPTAPVVTVRRFTRNDGATPAHATVATDAT